ncbi:MAG: family 16 glycoside hydrolase [Saprospiraceae bacterium]
MKWFLLFVSILFFSCNQSEKVSKSSDWELLFNEQNLNNWEVRNGTAEYIIEEKELVGTAKLNTPNTFLCPKKMYDDFILELELKIDQPLNSGIQIRSNSIPTYYDGAVHGYQVEVDPSPRAFSGGIYDESRRGWIYPLCENSEGRKGFKNDTWNKYRIEAIGPSIRVWVNGIQTANLQDDLTAKGFIGLQVHSIGKDSSMVGKTVRWRNIKIATNNLEKLQTPDDGKTPEINLVPNQLSDREKEKGYTSYLNERENIRLKEGESIGFESVENFDLKFEFNLSKNAEGGIEYFSNEKNEKCIFQIIDNDSLSKAEQKGNQSLASLKGIVTSQNLCVLGRHRDFRGLGNWNTGRIIVQNGKIEHWMNGYKMVEKEISELNLNWKKELHQISIKNNMGEVNFRSVRLKKL